MDYKDRRLVVKKAGYYYVYSKVSFKSSKYYTHTIMLSDPDFEFEYEIISSVKRQWGLENEGISNSYLGGVVYLCKGCKVFVKVSDTSNISGEKCENFFGAFMI